MKVYAPEEWGKNIYIVEELGEIKTCAFNYAKSGKYLGKTNSIWGKLDVAEDLNINNLVEGRVRQVNLN